MLGFSGALGEYADPAKSCLSSDCLYLLIHKSIIRHITGAPHQYEGGRSSEAQMTIFKK